MSYKESLLSNNADKLGSRFSLTYAGRPQWTSKFFARTTILQTVHASAHSLTRMNFKVKCVKKCVNP